MSSAESLDGHTENLAIPVNLSPGDFHTLHVESGIAPEVITARGYTTATKKSQLRDLGFAQYQQRVPALVVPVHAIYGEVAFRQIRPQAPRHDKKGKPIKYETPSGAQMTLDVPPLPQNRLRLKDPALPLWLTEGCKKADALVTHNCCAVALLGVWNFRGRNEAGGTTLLADFESIHLKERVTYIVFDSDAMVKDEVYGALARFGGWLKSRHAQVRYIYLPSGESGRKVGADDFLVAGGTVDALLALATPTLRARPQQDTKEDARPIIQVGTDIAPVEHATLTAIQKASAIPRVFQRARALCFIGTGTPAPKGLRRPPDTSLILTPSAPWLRKLASTAAIYQRFDARKNAWIECLPPPWVIDTILAETATRDLPVLDGIISAPTLRPDGTLLDRPGYDELTGLWYDNRGIDYPPITIQSPIDDARTAYRALHDVIKDFPFRSQSDACAALAALLSLICRHAIDGNVPMFPITSTIRGSGKGTLIDVIATISTGRAAPRWAQIVSNDEEERKRLLTIAMAGDATIHIDNVLHPLGGAVLDLALTTSAIKDRVLGKNEVREAPLTAVWFASGNNLQFKGDFARRCCPIFYDPQRERPEERDDFTYPLILKHVRAIRPALAMAALTIVLAYCHAERPAQSLSAYGSFQEWSDLIRSAVVWCTGMDPCEGRKGLEASNDPAFEHLDTLLRCWEACYSPTLDTTPETPKALPTTPQTLTAVLQDISLNAQPIDRNNPANKYHDLRDALAKFDPTYKGHQLDARVLGNALSKVSGRIIEKRRFVRSPERGKNGYAWFVAGVANVASVTISGTPWETVKRVFLPKTVEKPEKDDMTAQGSEGENATPDTPATPIPPPPQSADVPAHNGTSHHIHRYVYMRTIGKDGCEECGALRPKASDLAPVREVGDGFAF